ncbi:MAG: hypothetical protein PQJ59_13995 [Spirochaetales bacterium]|nr:hypothetical protein [Spirochaetales bacterium]
MKDKIYNATKYIILFVAIAQLALSQVHIQLITKVFAPYVGFYLFLFVIFGLVTGFNTTSSLAGSKVILFIAGCVLACVMGGLYLNILFKDIATGNYLSLEDAKMSIIFMFITLGVYSLGGLIMVFTRPPVVSE